MSAPRHAYESENGRYYHIPGIEQPLVSVTNAISVGLSKYGLPMWYANQATEAAWQSTPLMVLALRRPLCMRTDEDACGVCRECVTRYIKDAAERARDSAAFLGSRVHELAAAHLLSQTLAEQDGDREAGLYVAQYLRFLEAFDVRLDRDVVAAEATVVNERAGYAGTGDIWLRLPFDGFTWSKGVLKVKRVTDPAQRGTFLVDIKVSRKRASTQSYPEHVMQLAGLRHATHLVQPDDTLTQNIRVTGAATLQLRAKTYRLIPLPAGITEYRLFQNVLALADWLHHTWPGGFEHRPITPTAALIPKRGTPKEQT